jgi:aldehyde:ferredoxin oxidoreductase
VYGVHGRYLRIDLPSGRATAVPLDEGVLRAFLGGVGLGAWLVAHETPAGLDPLGPDAALAFVFSPLVGSPLTTSAKFAVVGFSPLTGRFCDALASSHFALAGKRTGFDALVLKGQAHGPSVVFVDGTGDGLRVEIEPAGELRGLPASAAEAQIRAARGNDWQVAAIGPAGEQLIPFATISHAGRHAGRGGLGAVLGSKRVKALAVRGDRRAPLADPVKAVGLARDLLIRSFGPATEKYRELGTVANLLVFNRFDALPTRNFQAGHIEGVERLAAEDLGPARQVAKHSCASCTIGCEHVYAVRPEWVNENEEVEGKGTGSESSRCLSPFPAPPRPAKKGTGTSLRSEPVPVFASGTPVEGENPEAGVRMEYESLFALGALCGVTDPQAVLRASAECDGYGLDTISTGGTIAFLMECAELGLVDGRLPGTGRLLRFGDGEALVEAVRALAGRRGALGALLALGSRRAAERIGGDALALAPQVKGMELPGYHPGRMPAMALGLAVGTRGADHNRSGAYEADFSERLGPDPDPLDVARAAVDTEDRAAVLDALILCKFLRGALRDLHAESVAMLAAVTGWDVSVDELRTVARRVVNARKCLNIREGWTQAEDTLPARLFEAPSDLSHRPPLTRARLDAQVAAYYRARGWTAEGLVPHSLRAELGLDGLVFGAG